MGHGKQLFLRENSRPLWHCQKRSLRKLPGPQSIFFPEGVFVFQFLIQNIKDKILMAPQIPSDIDDSRIENRDKERRMFRSISTISRRKTSLSASTRCSSCLERDNWAGTGFSVEYILRNSPAICRNPLNTLPLQNKTETDSHWRHILRNQFSSMKTGQQI